MAIKGGWPDSAVAKKASFLFPLIKIAQNKPLLPCLEFWQPTCAGVKQNYLQEKKRSYKSPFLPAAVCVCAVAYCLGHVRLTTPLTGSQSNPPGNDNINPSFRGHYASNPDIYTQPAPDWAEATEQELAGGEVSLAVCQVSPPAFCPQGPPNRKIQTLLYTYKHYTYRDENGLIWKISVFCSHISIANPPSSLHLWVFIYATYIYIRPWLYGWKEEWFHLLFGYVHFGHPEQDSVVGLLIPALYTVHIVNSCPLYLLYFIYYVCCVLCPTMLM